MRTLLHSQEMPRSLAHYLQLLPTPGVVGWDGMGGLLGRSTGSLKSTFQIQLYVGRLHGRRGSAQHCLREGWNPLTEGATWLR